MQASVAWAILPNGVQTIEQGLAPTTIGDRVVRSPVADQVSYNRAFSAGRLPHGSVSDAPQDIWPPSDLDQLNRLAFDGDWDAVKTWVAKRASVFGLAPQDLLLQKNDIYQDDQLTFVKLRVRRGDLRIKDAYIDLRFSHHRLVQVQNFSYAAARTPSDTDLQQMLQKQSLMEWPEGWRPSTNNMSQVYYRVSEDRTTLVPVLGREAQRGAEIYWVEWNLAGQLVHAVMPQRLYARGVVVGEVFPRSYADRPETFPMGFAAIKTDDAGTSTWADAAGTFDVAQGIPRIQGLRSRRVNVSNSDGELLQGVATGATNGWEISLRHTPSADPFEGTDMAQTMGYFHTTRVIEYARQFIQIPWFDVPLEVDVNHDDTCNAYWNGQSINFYKSGDGCANSALLADVIYHEWGHGLDANTGGIEDSAFSEGFGDIIFMIMTDHHQLAPGFFTDGRFIRDMAIPKKYPDDLRGEPHGDGRIIGSTFWDLYQALIRTHGPTKAKQLISRYAFKMISTASRFTDVYGALKVIDDDDGNLGNGTPNLCLLNEVFKAHGLAATEHSCWLGLWQDTRFDDDSGGNGNGVLEPGEIIQMRVLQQNDTDRNLDSLRGSLTALDPMIQLIQTDISWDTLHRQQGLWSREQAEFRIDPTMPCGKRFTLTGLFQDDLKTMDQSRQFEIGRYLGTPHIYHLPGLPFRIPDGTTTDYPIDVSDAPWVEGMGVYRAQVKLAGVHAYSRELSIDLIPPGGEPHRVYKAGIGRNPPVVADVDLTAMLYSGAGQGQWLVRIRDANRGDVGRLDQFELILEPMDFVCEPMSSFDSSMP